MLMQMLNAMFTGPGLIATFSVIIGGLALSYPLVYGILDSKLRAANFRENLESGYFKDLLRGVIGAEAPAHIMQQKRMEVRENLPHFEHLTQVATPDMIDAA